MDSHSESEYFVCQSFCFKKKIEYIFLLTSFVVNFFHNKIMTIFTKNINIRNTIQFYMLYLKKSYVFNCLIFLGGNRFFKDKKRTETE